MERRILHVLSQRPSRTGSGVTLDAVVRQAARAGWKQAAVVGVPAGETAPQVGGLPAADVRRVTFADPESPGAPPADLDFPVPGMSDVMPYPSSVWSRLDAPRLEQYRAAWRARLRQVLDAFAPDLIHAHHVWLVSSLLRDLAPRTPVVVTCHSTGLRQMQLCPGLRDEVVAGCRRLDRFLALRKDQGDEIRAALDLPADRVTVVGAGYREDLFRPGDEQADRARRLVYVGKYSHAKGLPWLLDALEALAPSHPGLKLHVAGGGAGPEADALRARMQAMAPRVRLHGQLDQPALADLLRRCAVCVLPSFYEGVPLVLVEAAACGCRLVSTALPGVTGRIAPHLGDRLELVPLPRLTGVDTPHPDDLPAFTAALGAAIARSLAGADRPAAPADLAPFTWQAVFGRVESVWRELLDP
jgi:glycosyltransferase involved in cell wall biosynthesis